MYPTFSKKTVRDNGIPVVGTDIALASNLLDGTKIISEEQAIAMARESGSLSVYTLSENTIGWISEHLAFTGLPEKIELFKNKLKFRELTRPMLPEFFFKGVALEEMKNFSTEGLPLPFIIKPAVGFFSMGVHNVSSHEQWPETVDAIMKETEGIKGLYPREVMDSAAFIIEQCIDGDEYAVDAYFDSEGNAVVLGIYKHVFSSAEDVSDRVYLTSADIIRENLQAFTAFIGRIGSLAGVKNFPMHVELRRDREGNILPIEVNPMRFGGWCTTADATAMAYGFNPYLCYYSQKKPGWDEILAGKEGKLFSIVVLDNSTGVQGKHIESFDYEKLLSGFEKPLELRRINYREYPVFGFLFTETREKKFAELENILNSDLKEFIKVWPPSDHFNP